MAEDEIQKPTDNGVRSFVTFRLAKVQAKLNAQAAAVLRAHSTLSLTEWRLLSLIIAAGEPTTAANVARDVQMDKAQVSRAVKSMLGAGIITTMLDAEDHRQILLEATPKGQELYDRIVNVMQRRQKWLTRNIGPADLEAFFNVLYELEKASDKRDF